MTKRHSFLALVLWWCSCCLGSAQITVTNPSIGQVVPGNSTLFVNWSGTDPINESVRLEFSSDAGTTWALIADGITGTNLYRWSPTPAINSATCVIRITAIQITGGRKVVQLSNKAATEGSGVTVVFTTTGEYAVVGDDKGMVSVFSASDGAYLSHTILNTRRIIRVDAFPNANRIAVLTDDDSILVMSIPDFTIQRRWHTGISRIVPSEDRGMHINPRDGRIAVSSFTRSGVFSEDGTLLSNLPLVTGGSNTWIWWTADDKLLISSGATRRFLIADPLTATIEMDWLDEVRSHRAWPSQDGTILYSIAKNAARIAMWDRQTGALLAERDEASVSMCALALYQDGAVLRTFYGPPSLFDRLNGNSLQPMDTIYTGQAGWEVAIHPDQQRVLSTSSPGGILILPPAGGSRQALSNLFTIQSSVVPSDSIVHIAVDNLEAKTSSDEFLVVRMLAQLKDPVNVTAYIVTLSWNPTMMVERDLPPSTIENGRRHLTRTIPSVASADGVLARIPMRTALGTDSISSVVLESVQPVGDVVTVQTSDGTLRLTDVCYAGGPRMINGDGIAKMAIAAESWYNQATVRLSAVESGPYSLLIHDGYGCRIYEQGWQSTLTSPEQFELIVDINGWGAGIFLGTLRTPSSIFRHSFIITR